MPRGEDRARPCRTADADLTPGLFFFLVIVLGSVAGGLCYLAECIR